MNNSSMISIVTPSLNQGKYIKDCIQSVINQNYPNFEHIIIDGGSKDGTIEILKKYSHLKWISESDEGQSDALNKGFKMASGGIICWLNADDVYLEGVFNKVLQELKSKEVDAVYADYYFTDKNLNITKKIHTHKPVKLLSLFYCFIPSATFFFKKKVIDAGLLIDLDFYISMDKEFFSHILYKGYRVKYYKDYFAKFRWHNSNKSIDSLKVKKIRFKESFEIFNRYSKIKLPKNKLGLVLYKSLAISLLLYRKIFKTIF